jgi:hypothetical protein
MLDLALHEHTLVFVDAVCDTTLSELPNELGHVLYGGWDLATRRAGRPRL